MSRPVVPLSVSTRAGTLLRPPTVVELARAAAGAGGGGRSRAGTGVLTGGRGGRPTLAVLMVDDEGLLVAVRDLDIGVADVPDSCATLLRLSPPTGLSVAVVVSVDPGFGVEVPACALTAWHEARRVFGEHETLLADWLLVADDTTVSVPRWFGEPAAW